MSAAKGLPMTAKWDPEKLEREIAELRALEQKPFWERFVGYLRKTGPGLLQSAMTLGAGSASASVIAGASFGYKLLWVQPAAMFLGVCMMAALANIVLTTQERPYSGFARQVGWPLVFLWALGTIVASVIWHFPQYTLAGGAMRDLVSSITGAEMETRVGSTVELTTVGTIVSWCTGALILGINIFTTWNYGSHARGIRMYEWFLRSVIALVIISFGIVVVTNIHKIDWLELLRGFTGWYGIPQVSASEGLSPEKRDSLTLVLGMLGAAVGINMTFVYGYSLLAKGWGPAHKTLAKWDLAMSMFIPFVLVTSLIMLAMTVSGVYRPEEEFVKAEMSPLEASKSLSQLMGARLGRVVFDLGLLGMCCGAISAHMVVCGFTMCEMLRLEYTPARYRLFTLTPAIGILGVVFNINRVIWFPIVASAIAFTMLPIAYLMFFILNNSRRYIGDAVGRGVRRWIFNAILLVALAMATVGSLIQLHRRVVRPIWEMVAPAKSAAHVDELPGGDVGRRG
ncbi:MAG: divalent metal cation transporter [Thermoguttaceae bacterium]|nr:divalent metal cation transporter [Thermoguttaceae bacterium]MDW8077566.1 divalent metal cation transporter [Thermoguttaceae bacterium]